MKPRLVATLVTVAATVPLALAVTRPAAALLDPGSVFISTEATAPNSSSSCTGAALLPPLRDAADDLDASWEVAADAEGLTDSYYLQLPIEDPSAANPQTYSFYDDIVGGAQLVPGGVPFTAAVSPRDVALTDIPDYGGTTGVASVGTLMVDGSGNPPQNTTVNSSAAMQDCAPYPTSYWDSDVLTAGAQTLPFWNNVDNSGISANTLDGVLFDFSTPIQAFGAWFGDVESRTVARPEDNEAPLAPRAKEPTPAYLKLFDASGNLIYESVILPSTTPQDDTTCGGPDITTDLLGCGNQSTRWVGFVVPAGQPPVARMLLTVGDDDSCVQVQDSQCDATTEHLSWIGARVRLAPSALTINKTEVGFDGAQTPGEGWTFNASYTPTGLAAPVTSLTTASTGPDGMGTISLTAETPIDLTITETQQPGWSLTSLTCTTPDGPDTDTEPDVLAGSLDGSSITFVNVLPHVDIDCSATNERVPSPLTINKTIVEGGATSPGDGWEFTASTPSGFSNLGSTVDGTLVLPMELTEPVDITVTETAQPGWTLSEVSCVNTANQNAPYVVALNGSGFVVEDVAPGDAITCSAVNVAATTLTVQKTEVTPEGEAPGVGWEFTATLGATTPIVASTDDLGIATFTMPGTTPQTLVLSETAQPAWRLGSVECSATDGADAPIALVVTPTSDGVSIADVPAGAAVECAVTNLREGISIAKDGPTDVVLPGQSIDFPIQVTNTGSSTSTDIIVVDNLPDGLSYSTFTGADWTCSNVVTIVTCNYALDLEPGASASLLTVTATVNADVAGGISLRNVAFVTSSTGTGTDDHEVDTESTTTSSSTTSSSTTAPPTTGPTTTEPTTTEPTTTEPTTTEPTTTEPTTSGPTTSAPASSTSLGSVQSSTSTSVAAATVTTATVAPATQAPDQLSKTGIAVSSTLLVGGLMTLSGLVLLRRSRRRNAS